MDSSPEVVGIDPSYVRLMQGIVRRRAPRRLRDDMMQECMLWMYENKARVEDSEVADRRAYVATSTYHLISRRALEEEREGGHVSIDLDCVAAADGDLSISEASELELLVTAVKDLLPGREAWVFECIVVRRWSVRETARELGLQPGQVRRSRRRIRQMLPGIVTEILQDSGMGVDRGDAVPVQCSSDVEAERAERTGCKVARPADDRVDFHV
jgi:RNA polymerase sigma factor (sigma-70 family)